MKAFPDLRSRTEGDKGGDSRHVQRALTGFVIALFFFGFAKSLQDPSDLGGGILKIIIEPDFLINDYVARSGFGAAFVNSALCALIALMILLITKVNITGPAVAAVFTVAGFALFGKTVFNIWWPLLGVWLYSKLSRRKFSENVIIALFGTALAPVSSEIAFGLGLHPVPGIALGILAGIGAGMVLPPLAKHLLAFHQGCNLYNIGFTAGFIGTVIMSIFRAFSININGSFSWAKGGMTETLPWLLLLFGSLILYGFFVEPNALRSLREIWKSSGRLVSDFVRTNGSGAAFVNMGIMGILACAYVLVIGADWNGPVIGAIFTITGFSAFGKNPFNAVPIMAGVALMAVLSRHTITEPAVVLATLFGTTLSPIAGVYGPIAGVVAGALHLVIVVNVGALHGGLNLYNNGFSGGLVASMLVPLLDDIKERFGHESR